MSFIRLTGASAFAVLGFAGIASAADVVRAPPPIPQQQPPAKVVTAPAGWGGAYAGVLGGYGWGTGSIDNDGWIGGGFVGFNANLTPHIVIGLEGDASLTSKSGSDGTTTVRNPWDATLRGRIGFGSDKWLLYGTAGLAAGEVKATTTGVTESETKVGWTAGAGIEAKVSEKTTVRVEYRHTDLGTATFASNPPLTYRSDDVLVGIGFKF